MTAHFVESADGEATAFLFVVLELRANVKVFCDFCFFFLDGENLFFFFDGGVFRRFMF